MASDTENQLAATAGQEILEDGHPIRISVSDSPHQDKEKISFLSLPLNYKVLIVVLATLIFMAIGSAMLAFSIALLASFPVLFPLYFIVILSLPKKTLKRVMGKHGHGEYYPSEPALEDMYNQARCKETLWGRIMWSSCGMIARVSLVMLVGLGLSIFVPTLKRVTLLGSPLWKWSLLSVTLTAAYVQAFVVTYLFIVIPLDIWRQENIVTQYFSGLELQITHVMYMGMALVSWLAYFRTEQGLKQASTPHPRAFECVTWTFVSLLVGSVLFLLKGLLLAMWSADAIYRRFEPRILITSLKYFFIGLAVAGFCEGPILDGLKVLNQYFPDIYERKGIDDRDMDSVKVMRFTRYIMSRRTGLGHLRYVSHILKSLAEIMSPTLDRDNDEEEEEVVNWFNYEIRATQPASTDSRCTPASLLELIRTTQERAETLWCFNIWAETSILADCEPAGSSSCSKAKQLFKQYWTTMKDSLPSISKSREMVSERQRRDYPKMAHMLCQLVREEGSYDATFGDLMIWMVDAHKDCINMGRTLADASAIVSRVDLLLSCGIVLIVLLLWLLITGFASTTVLVTIATPLLALTFIFGDTAKTFFQGLIFCFATHPFDVGDRCIVDDAELEVKRVNILTTTFTKIGSKEKRVYPNAVLATKPILNLGWQPDSKDVVELILNPSTDLGKLKENITKFFNEEENWYKYKNSCCIVINELGDNVKVTVHFSHILTVHDLSHSQCLKKKSLQRFDLLNMIKNHISNKSETEEVVHAMPRLDSSRSSQSTTSV